MHAQIVQKIRPGMSAPNGRAHNFQGRCILVGTRSLGNGLFAIGAVKCREHLRANHMSFNRINAELQPVAGCGERPADWKSAIQSRTGGRNLRYELAARWGPASYPFLAASRTRSRMTSAICGSLPMLGEYQSNFPCFSVGLRHVGWPAFSLCSTTGFASPSITGMSS